MDLYRELILDHYTNPRNSGVLPQPTHSASYDNPICGDQVSVSLIVHQNQIQQIKFQVSGCVIATATASLLSEKVIHQSLDQINSLTLEDLIVLLGTPLTTSRQQCALVPLQALKSALNLNK